MTINRSAWQEMDLAPKDGTRVLLAYECEWGVDFDVGMWVQNYGCPGWYAAGTFVEPIMWTSIPPFENG